jgi:hypothetical protein
MDDTTGKGIGSFNSDLDPNNGTKSAVYCVSIVKIVLHLKGQYISITKTIGKDESNQTKRSDDKETNETHLFPLETSLIPLLWAV